MKGCPQCGQSFEGEEEFCPTDGETLVDMTDDTNDPLIGETLDGRYFIQKKLGEGGMALVYLARDVRHDREVAIKVLPDAFAADADRLARFEQEARLLLCTRVSLQKPKDQSHV